MAAQNIFEHPHIDWNASDLYKEFCRFKRHVEFVLDGPLDGQTDKQKAGWIGTWIGAEGREVWLHLPWAAGNDGDLERQNPTVILDKYRDYVRPRSNKRMARNRLKHRKQGADETFDSFVKDLRMIIMDCSYTDADDILVDYIIDGVKDLKLQEKLLDKGGELTLAQAITLGQQFELSRKQMAELHYGEDTRVSTKAFAIKTQKQRKPSFQKPPPAKQSRPPPRRESSSPANACDKCGKDRKHSWSNGNCPAKNAKCSYCKFRGHWLVCCPKRLSKVHAVDAADNPQFLSFPSTDDRQEGKILGIHQLKSAQAEDADKWSELLLVNRDIHMSFRIDTGAKCNTIVLKEYQKLQHKGELQRSRTILSCYFNVTMAPVASVVLPVERRTDGRQLELKFEIVDIEQENILSGDAAEALGLITRVWATGAREQPPIAPGLEDFPEVAWTTGTLPGKYRIKIEEGAHGVVHSARRQPAALKDKIVEKLHEMEADGVLVKVETPTEWVSSMVASVRGDKVRICIDPSDLNKVIKREHHPMKTIEEVVTEVGPDAKVFSVLDAKSGFLQIELDEESSYLTTFNTPIGRYRWTRLPFGVKCAPEIFQRIMDEMLSGIRGAFSIMDDILVAGRDTPHHDEIIREVLQKATEYNLKLNMKKCKIRQPEVPYVGHIVGSAGLKPDPQKVTAVQEMAQPESKEDLKRFLGFIQYLGKFIPKLSEVDAPLRELTKADVEFQWQPAQQRAFDTLKELCCKAPVLRFYDPNKPVEIQCDASQSGLGAVLMQEGQPVAYSSRSLTDTEKRYAQIEKEMLSIVHACKKFHCYIMGKQVTVFNDHKPLEVIFTKPLLAAPMRLQRMLLSLQWYDLRVEYRKGSLMTLPDTLSRAQLPDAEPEIRHLEHISMIDFISVSKDKYTQIQQATQMELSTLYTVIQEGWPDTRRQVPMETQPYWDTRAQLSVIDGIIYNGMRIVIPPSLRPCVLQLVHESHLGMVKCKQRAREAVYWPGLNADIENLVRNCSKCAEYQKKQPAEPLEPTQMPELPYQEVGTDIFDFEGENFLITVDYYSQFIEVDALQDLRSATVIRALKAQFSRHGIPRVLRSDCGTQYMAREFKQMTEDYGIEHKPSSPHFQSSNGEAERAVQTVKSMWRKAEDRFLALLDYRTTPLPGVNLSPAQLLMGRRPRNTLPIAQSLLEPSSYNRKQVRRERDLDKVKQKFYHDESAHELPPLYAGNSVRMLPLPGEKSWRPAEVVSHTSPRSYVVKTDQGRLYRRNRRHLRRSTQDANVAPPTTQVTYDDDDVQELPMDTGSQDIPVTPPATPRAAPKPHAAPIPHATSEPTLPVADLPTYTTRAGRTVRPPKKMDI